jgi:quercetin dioxygenase-like cupin family protein
VPTFVERNFISNKEGVKESLLACTGESTSTLVQLREPLTEHSHDTAEVLYVVAGEATHRVDGKEETLTAGAFSAIPRGMLHSLTRRGRNPVIVISTVSGKPCVESAATTARTR